MDNDTKTTGKDKNTAQWSRSDELTLVRALKRSKEDGKWGDNNPKDVTWTLCVAALYESEKISGGVPKDSKAIKRRWQHVRVTICPSPSLHYIRGFFLQMKQEYILLKQMCAQSGWGWDHENNTPEVSDPVWNAYISVGH